MKRDWVVTIGIDKFYITKEQKDFYLESVNKGAKYVTLDDSKILGANFQSLVSINEFLDVPQLEKGLVQCRYGKWHKREQDCMCSISYEIVDGIAKRKPSVFDLLDELPKY